MWVVINVYLYLVLNLVLVNDFFKYVITICISDKYWTFFRACCYFFVLQIILNMYATYLTTETSRHGFQMVRIDTIIFCWFYLCSQYQFNFSFVLMRYWDRTASSTDLITFLLVFMSSFNVNKSDTYFTI